MPEEDENTEAQEAVNHAAGVRPPFGEELLTSPELIRQLQEAKDREREGQKVKPRRKFQSP